MQAPKPFTFEIDGVAHTINFDDFDVMTDSDWNAPLATGALRLTAAGSEPIVIHYEEWLDELGDGSASRWGTGLEDQWNDALPKVSRDGVSALHDAVDEAVTRRLRGSGWRSHL